MDQLGWMKMWGSRLKQCVSAHGYYKNGMVADVISVLFFVVSVRVIIFCVGFVVELVRAWVVTW